MEATRKKRCWGCVKFSERYRSGTGRSTWEAKREHKRVDPNAVICIKNQKLWMNIWWKCVINNFKRPTLVATMQWNGREWKHQIVEKENKIKQKQRHYFMWFGLVCLEMENLRASARPPQLYCACACTWLPTCFLIPCFVV